MAPRPQEFFSRSDSKGTHSAARVPAYLPGDGRTLRRQWLFVQAATDKVVEWIAHETGKPLADLSACRLAELPQHDHPIVLRDMVGLIVR